MKDESFTKLLQKTGRAGNRYGALLQKAEKEYERRYGVNPSDAEDDMWIDGLHITGSCSEDLTADKVESGATQYARLNRKRK